MKFSYAMLPDYPLSESLASIRLADELGFYAVYAADEPWHKDMWLLFAAAAAQTTRIRMGPSLSAVTLREPSLIAQAAATLDELTGGRAEVVLGSGNFGVLAQYNIDWTTTKPLTRVKEAVEVVRTLLDEGAITRDGEFYSYRGCSPSPARCRTPTGQDRCDARAEVVRGGREFSDGCHHALSYTRAAYEYASSIRIGAERAGKDWRSLDIGAWVVFAVGRTRRRPRKRPAAWSASTPRRCRRAARTQRCGPRGGGSDHQGHRSRRPRPGHRADHPGARREALPGGHARRVRRRSARTSRPPESTT